MGPTLPISIELHEQKYRAPGETFAEAMDRLARCLADGEEHYRKLFGILLDMRFLPAGRIQAAIGAERQVTPYNCFVSPTIPDSMDGIMDVATKAATTMRLGGGIGYDFSTLRPRGDLIHTLKSTSSGPVSFMRIYDAVCKTICSAGHRRGAQMGVLRVDHPDIEEFVEAKHNSHDLTAFNVSVAITDEFMTIMRAGGKFDLRFGGKRYKTVDARALWDQIMRSTWDWAEPGVLFIDRINRMNNLWYCEEIAATNPCAEQPLPPNGACLLGSVNLTRYLRFREHGVYLDFDQLSEDIPVIVRAMDNVIDRAIYPLPKQRLEALAKRRMGIGLAGTANAIEALGHPYGSYAFREVLHYVFHRLTIGAYVASADLAAEKGAFPLYDEKYLNSAFINTLPSFVRKYIAACGGIRNSHLTSIAPTGTISLTADNISSGIEPVFAHSYTRTIITPEGPRDELVQDYGVAKLGVRGKTADQCSIDDHLGVLLLSQNWVDSAVSKTCNVGPEVSFEEFEKIYERAWEGGAKGCTTFRSAGKRYGILNAAETEELACVIDPTTGRKSCE